MIYIILSCKEFEYVLIESLLQGECVYELDHLTGHDNTGGVNTWTWSHTLDTGH